MLSGLADVKSFKLSVSRFGALSLSEMNAAEFSKPLLDRTEYGC